jgi:hypothetical protein
MKKRYIVGGALAAVIVVGAVAAGSGGDDDDTTPTTAVVVTTTLPEPGRISLAEFEALREGMTYEQVVAVIGGPGELGYESSSGSMTMKGYTWHGTQAVLPGNASISFMDDALTSKAQFGLE